MEQLDFRHIDLPPQKRSKQDQFEAALVLLVQENFVQPHQLFLSVSLTRSVVQSSAIKDFPTSVRHRDRRRWRWELLYRHFGRQSVPVIRWDA